MKTPVAVHDFDARPFLERIPDFDYDPKYKVLKATKNGSVRWKFYYWVYLSAAPKGKYVGIEELGNGIWKVFYRNALLGYFNEKQRRNKEQATRLETEFDMNGNWIKKIERLTKDMELLSKTITNRTINYY